MDPSTYPSFLTSKDRLLLIEVTAKTAQRAIRAHDKPLAAHAIQEILRHVEALTQCPDCPKP